MHDIKQIRNDPQEFEKKLARRGEQIDADLILGIDTEIRQRITSLDSLRQERNSVSKQIGEMRRDGQDSSELETRMREVGTELKTGEERLREMQVELKDILSALPNLPEGDTPDGLTEADNIVVREWGSPPEFDFEPDDHLKVSERLKLLDFKRGGKITGSGFPVWSGEGASLERALLNFMLDLHVREFGYREMLTPFMANYDSMYGTGQIPHLENDMYRCPKSDKTDEKTGSESLFLIPTSEVPLINLHRDEIIDESLLPIRYAAYSPCFRREAGAYGHHTRGFLRVHQFNKVELVRIERPEESLTAFEELLSHAEEALRRLELHYRVIRLCAGELAFQAGTCYDLEVWAPAEKQWLEVSSVSHCYDFQARRANIKYKPKSGGKPVHVHTLNGSGVATSRLFVALLETYQTDEGSLAIPSVLRPYMNGQTVITAG